MARKAHSTLTLVGAGLLSLAAIALLVGTGAGQEVRAERLTLVHDGIERAYFLTVPPQVLSASPRVPLVIVLHGGGNGVNAMDMTGFAEKAIEEGFIAVFPEGTGRTTLLTWNAGHCCGYAMTNDIDDVGFIAALIDALVASQPVDPDRVYVTGMSNGAMMTHRLGIELAERIVAIGPVVGGLFGDEPNPAAPVSAIIFNGALDQSIPMAGGPTGGRFAGAWDGTPLIPAAHQAAYWAAADRCNPAAEVADGPVFTLSRYSCPPGIEVEYYLVKDNGHAWPGGRAGSVRGDVPTELLNATEMMWDFFRLHSRAGALPVAPAAP